MELIRDILQKLSNQEIKRLKSYIKNNSHEFEKVGKLFDLVIKYTAEDENFFARKLYQKDAENSFRVTKARLKRLLEEVLIGEKSLKEYEAEYITAQLNVKKRLLQGEILMGRGAYLASRNLLEQVIVTAKKYNFQDELYQASMLLFRHTCTSLTANELSREVENLKQLSYVAARIHEAGILYYQLSGLLASTTLRKASEFRDARKTIDTLELIWKETHSPLAGFYYLKTAIYYTQITYEYTEARRHCQELLDLVRSSPALKSKQREGAALLQLSEVCLRGEELSRADTFIRATLSLYQPDELNYLIALETAFRIAFFRKDMDECSRILHEAGLHPALNLSKLRAGRWKYFEAAFAFRSGKYKECMKLLNEATPVMADKLGWNIAFRLLEIMSLYEAGQKDLIETKIENIRQFAKRNKHDNEFTRAWLLVELLNVWHKNEYDFEQAGTYIQKVLGRIEDYHGKVPFNPASFELIRFDLWIARHSSATRHVESR